MCCSTGTAQVNYSSSLSGATLIYSNAYNGGALVNINGTQPNYAASLFGGTNSATWLDALGSLNTNAFYANGSVGTGQGDSIILPFKPQTGYIYTLAASVSFTGNPGNWVGVGFAQNYTNTPANESRYADSGIDGYDFAILTESSGNVRYLRGAQACAGPGNLK